MLRLILAVVLLSASLDAGSACAQGREGFRRGQGQGSGPGQESVRDLAERANAAFQQGRYVQAERLYARLLELRERGAIDRGPPLSAILSRLGYSMVEQARYVEAEPLLRRALALAEAAGERETRVVAGTLTSLGSVLQHQGRPIEAEPLIRRAMAIREQPGQDPAELANSLGHLSRVLRDLRRLDEAEAALRRALAIREARLGADSSFVGMTLNGLAATLKDQGRLAEALVLAERSVAIQERLGPTHPRLAMSLHGFGMVKLAAGDDAGAEPLLRRAAEIRTASLGPLHPHTARSFGQLAQALARQDRTAEALIAVRRATEIARSRRDEDDRRYDEGTETERRSASGLFARHAAIAHQAALRAAPGERDELMAEAFEMAQWARTGAVAGALAHMAARFAAGAGPLADLVRQRQDALAERQALDRGLLDMLSRPPQERVAVEENATRDEIAALGRRLNELDKTISRDFPAFAELAAARPLKLSQTKQLLGPDEALLLYLVRDDDAFLWAVRRDRTLWLRLEAPAAAIEESVRALRSRLNPAENPDFAPVPLERAHRLYRDVLAPAEQALAGARHLLVVADGPLQSMPFGLLVATAPRDGDERKAEWLLRRFAVSVLPSVSSLQALRAAAARPAQREPFAGFGDPALAGRRDPTGGRGATPVVMRGYVADADALQALEPLPETANELAALARHLRARPGSVWTRAEATETKVKTTDLARFRVLAFATHGLMAGEFLDFAEPSLVLTPPAVGTREDDGLLTASEVAQLRLDADWVILSACNTAAPDAKPGAEGLSGLAKAFFYAGARSLLVSHWYVASEAAVRLTTGAVAAMDREPGLGRAEALRRSMLAMLDDPRTPKQMAHPAFWAPFVLVGEGGAGR